MTQGETLSYLILLRSRFTPGLSFDTITSAIKIIDERTKEAELLTNDRNEWRCIASNLVGDLSLLKGGDGWNDICNRHVKEYYAKANEETKTDG